MFLFLTSYNLLRVCLGIAYSGLRGVMCLVNGDAWLLLTRNLLHAGFGDDIRLNNGSNDCARSQEIWQSRPICFLFLCTDLSGKYPYSPAE